MGRYMSQYDNTEFVLRVAQRRRTRRKVAPVRHRSPIRHATFFTKRFCLVLFVGVALLYARTFGLPAGLPWATFAALIAWAPVVP